MPAHDIIDNRNQKLVDHIKRILSSSEAARFAVGYFFLSGLTPIADKLAHVKELQLLIGNTTNLPGTISGKLPEAGIGCRSSESTDKSQTQRSSSHGTGNSRKYPHQPGIDRSDGRSRSYGKNIGKND